MGHNSRANAFWYDADLPFIEARAVTGGHAVCFDRHSHETFSIGMITSGRVTYMNERHQQEVAAGATTIMNPEQVHACNPIGDAGWSYLMLYIDADWLGALQSDLDGTANSGFRNIATKASTDPQIAREIARLYAALTAPDASNLEKEVTANEAMANLLGRLGQARKGGPIDMGRGNLALEFISDNWSDKISLADICAASGLSPTHLIRIFKSRLGMTPHEYLVNRRVQKAREHLRQGLPIAHAAQLTGFFDQAHFHRAFKKLTGASPGEYVGVTRAQA